MSLFVVVSPKLPRWQVIVAQIKNIFISAIYLGLECSLSWLLHHRQFFEHDLPKPTCLLGIFRWTETPNFVTIDFGYQTTAGV